MPWRRWFTTILMGEIIWMGALVLIGHHVTLTLRRMEAGLQIVAIVGIIIPENIIHYLKMPGWTRPILERLAWQHMRLTYNRLDRITTPTATAAAILRKQSIRPPVCPISCGVDQGVFRPDPSLDRAAMRRRYGLDPNRAVFLLVGRVDQEKRLDVLLRALSLLKQDGVQVAIAGRGRYSGTLERLAHEQNLGGPGGVHGVCAP